MSVGILVRDTWVGPEMRGRPKRRWTEKAKELVLEGGGGWGCV